MRNVSGMDKGIVKRRLFGIIAPIAVIEQPRFKADRVCIGGERKRPFGKGALKQCKYPNPEPLTARNNKAGRRLHGNAAAAPALSAAHGYIFIFTLPNGEYYTFFKEFLTMQSCYILKAAKIQMSASTSAALVSGFTLGIMWRIKPSSSIMNVVRATPIEVLPYSFFSCHTPYA